VNFLDLFRRKKAEPKKEPPKILTPYGPTTEWARQQAMVNMLKDPAVKDRVLLKLVEQTGSLPLAELEFQRRYPEMFEEE